MRKQSVIFDMDGTLFDTETIFQEEWNRLARERGLALPPDFKYAICGTSGEAMNRIIERYYHVPEGSEIQRLCKERVARRLAEHVPEKEGARELISFFHEKGWSLAIGSSSPAAQIRANLSVTGLLPFFAAIASGDEVQRGKPAPDIFLLAARKLGASPKDCFVFEDSPNGILAAYAAGMKPVMVPDLMPATEDIRQKCFALFHSLTEARQFFMARL